VWSVEGEWLVLANGVRVSMEYGFDIGYGVFKGPGWVSSTVYMYGFR
jgi:hypothetical protein